MIFDPVVKPDSILQAIKNILFGLTNNLTARDNMAPEGTAGQVLTSNGPDRVPSYQDVPKFTIVGDELKVEINGNTRTVNLS